MELNKLIAAEVCRLVNDLVAGRIDSIVEDGRAVSTQRRTLGTCSVGIQEN